MDKKTYESLKTLMKFLGSLNWYEIPNKRSLASDYQQVTDWMDEVAKDYYPVEPCNHDLNPGGYCTKCGYGRDHS